DARNADIRADIYSLGCSLYFMLTARPPFPGKDMLEKLGPRVTGEAPWIRTVRADVPPGLEEVIRKMMARRPEDRYQTPLEAAQALAPYAAPLPETSRANGTSRDVAQALPLTGPVTAVAMAMPVPAGTEVGNIALAKPVDASAATLEFPPAPAGPPAE